MPTAPMYRCYPYKNNFVLIIVLFILLIIVGTSICKW
ncbi:YjcZ family sporulation protein [Halobacillus yeomjeoni]|uniref:YjcZ family sporulation protein n=2 Tax=Halobacillus yeomjeoni TaxID=311194 RepID=A0A931HUB8_9BACI|nr:YjcZ family sporulation protein [Halobacillus yeomjeoni]MBH0229553.1 YjcZ family sporulation protein [Halobacillus yeomjeoni]MCA0983056.1 YjcZ family sporulation protein [Halobacillus yeomjeoni]